MSIIIYVCNIYFCREREGLAQNEKKGLGVLKFLISCYYENSKLIIGK